VAAPAPCAAFSAGEGEDDEAASCAAQRKNPGSPVLFLALLARRWLGRREHPIRIEPHDKPCRANHERSGQHNTQVDSEVRAFHGGVLRQSNAFRNPGWA